MIMTNPTDLRSRHYNTLLGLLVLLSTFFGAHSQCDSTKACYPPVFDILDSISRYPARSIYASSTCGGNSSSPVQYRSLLSSDVNIYTCTPASIQPINVADEEAGQQPTYWQSNQMIGTEGATPIPQFLVFNFTDEFLFHEIYIIFTVPHLQNRDNSADARPAAFSIEKMDASGPNWVALHHYARNCATSFPGIPVYDPFDANSSPTTVFCEQYPPVTEGSFFDDDNYAEYNPGFNFYVHNTYYTDNLAAISRYTASAIRLNFLVPASARPMMSYVAISDVILEVQCKCFGHAQSCSGPNNATCNCQHNTTAHQCHQCLPLYNQREWTLGTSTDAGACLECACSEHATSCTFDPVKGHGVCDNCTDNTTGDSCDTCVSGYYVNPTRVNVTGLSSTVSPVSSGNSDTSSAGFCLACNCNQDGTQPASLSTCDVTTGQCVCKERVTERDCSACKDTYWGLKLDNPQGCDVCSCNAQGSIGSANMCDKTSGVCLCKANVEGTACDTCKPNTYAFSASNPDGCTQCDCDPGASLNKSCDLTSGQCTCRSNLGGRDCRFPASGQYVPRLDAIVLEPETFTTQNVVLRSGHGNNDATVSGRGFVTLTPSNQINMTFTARLSGQMDVVVRFEKTTQDTLIILQGTLRLTAGGSYSCNGATIQAGQQWTLAYNGVRAETRGGLSMGEVCLNAGSSYIVQITSQGSALLIDSIVFIPETAVLLTTLVDRMNLDNMTKCTEAAANKIRSTRDDCAAIEYSLMAAFFNGPVACSCSGGALASTGCNSHSGDCYCLPGVLTPDCTQCMVDHYQFSTTTGCTACACHETGSLVNYCDAQGVCQCRPNVQGTKCDSCAPEHYGLYTGKGCTPCQCNPTYSVNNNCNDTGSCSCLPGVQGPLCQACMDGHYNLTSNGCTQCACDPNGSTDRSCNVITGNCECLPSVEGGTCSSCKAGYFGLGQWHPDGCIPCFCWGHGSNCSSATGWFDAPISSAWLLSDPNALTEVWVAEDSAGTRVSVQTPEVGSESGQRYAMRVDPTQRTTRDIFYVAPAKFLGNRQSSYGRYLTIVLKPSTSSSSSSNTNTSVGNENYGDVLLQGSYSNATFIYIYNEAVQNRSLDSEITAKVLLRETAWQAVYTTETNNVTTRTVSNATYYQFMEMLAGLSSLRIKAYQANTSNSAMDLLSVRLETSVDGAESAAHSNITVNNVELCACELGYMGDSCQQCAKDYTRATPNSTHPSSQCVPCSCNGHGVTHCDELASDCSRDGVTSCDPLTGVCACQHNTKGDHCELCLPGYYGDPLKGTADDCLPCACPGLIVANDTNVFASNCSQNAAGEPVCNNCQEGHTGNHCELCVDGYFGTPENATNFGGACRPCECNGRADTCDTRTGECVACRNNTAGQECDICAPMFFGDAMNAECQPCNCTSPGSTGQCDHVTGVCECLPFVSGARCDVCVDETFNLTAGVGCQPCDCFMNGSTSTVCEKNTGQCSCRGLVEGRRCDECQESYWDVNIVTGCNPCQCNSEGTAKDNGTTVTSCDVITGQCTCALPGIVGRTCDVCSPVSKYTFDHINLFYIGVYPDCVLCGECFDSWALRIDEIGQQFTEMNSKLVGIWNNYDNQTAVQISTELAVIEEKVNRTTASLSNFEVVAGQLQELYNKFSQELTRHSAISSEVNMLTQTEQSLSTTLDSLVILTDMVQVTNVTATSLTTLRQQYDELIRETEAAARQGNTSWIHIQSLAFVVASPEDRERQLRQQAEKLIQIAALANQTLTLTKNLHETSLKPGTDEKERELQSASGTMSNVTVTLTEVRTIIDRVQNDVISYGAALTPLVGQSAVARDNLLQVVSSLQEYVTNASRAQRAADKLYTDAVNFKTVAEKAEQTVIDSMTALLESIASLEQAQSDLVKALSQSTAVQSVQLPSQASLQLLVEQIANASVSEEAVDNLKLKSQESLFLAEESVRGAQKALTMTRELNEEVQLMHTDVMAARDLRVQALGLKMASDTLNSSIHAILQEAQDHSDKADTDVTTVTQSAQEIQAEIRNVTSCLTQRQLDVTNAVTSANQAKARAESASSAQLALLEVMYEINSEESAAGMSGVLSNLTEADSIMRDMESNLQQLEALAQMEALIQELTLQNQEITDLDLEITQLTSELDSIILLLQESNGGSSCNST